MIIQGENQAHFAGFKALNGINHNLLFNQKVSQSFSAQFELSCYLAFMYSKIQAEAGSSRAQRVLSVPMQASSLK
jgi:hypothetical protein